MTYMRVATTPQLLDIMNRTRELGLNRQAPDLYLSADGFHVLSMMLWGHNMDFAPVLHHRVGVMAKVGGQDTPAEFFLDLDAAQWEALPLAADVTGEPVA